ncbi:AraC-like DNA-binding protein [Rhizobium aquaticum]|uniref:AraC-like DNA-binding protein n=1 Tax=Rhizobium aquaticum TaxID=1549636 RepID=A0ABV2ITH7_9HYPH
MAKTQNAISTKGQFTEIVVDAFGDDILKTLQTELGGLEIPFPKPEGMSETHVLAQVLGYDLAVDLVREVGTGLIYIPRANGRDNRDDEYLKAYNAGMTQAEIALVMKVSQRHVRRVLNGALGIRNRNFLRWDRHHRSHNKLSAEEVQNRERVLNEVLDGEITIEAAAKELNLSVSLTTRILESFVKVGSRRPLEVGRTRPHAKSNAGLTGIAGKSGTGQPAAPENRASGL